MKKTFGLAVLTAAYFASLAIGSSVSQAGSEKAATPAVVVEHHISAMMTRDVDEVLKDYADDAIMILANGTYVGKSELREAFMKFLSPKAPAPSSMSLASTKGEVAVEDWIMTTPSGEIRGSDMFVIRHGKIEFQTLKPSMPMPTSKLTPASN